MIEKGFYSEKITCFSSDNYSYTRCAYDAEINQFAPGGSRIRYRVLDYSPSKWELTGYDIKDPEKLIAFVLDNKDKIIDAEGLLGVIIKAYI